MHNKQGLARTTYYETNGLQTSSHNNVRKGTHVHMSQFKIVRLTIYQRMSWVSNTHISNTHTHNSVNNTDTKVHNN